MDSEISDRKSKELWAFPPPAKRNISDNMIKDSAEITSGESVGPESGM